MVMNHGTRVTTREQWKARRAEMRRLLQYALTHGNLTQGGEGFPDRLLTIELTEWEPEQTLV